MAAITAEMALEVGRFRAGINQINQMLRSHAASGDKAGRDHGRNYSRGFSREFSSMLKGLLAAAGITGIGFAAGQQFVAAMKDAANRERFEIGVASLTGDASAGDELFTRFRKLAKETGADLDQLTLQARRAIGQGMDTSTADQMVRSALDIQGSLALTNEETQRLINGFLQVKSKGVAAMEELRQQIAEKGVPIFDALSSQFGMEKPELFKAIEQGILPAEAVLDVFINLRGEFERFRGGAAKMAETLGGAWNVVQAQWRDLRIEFSEPIADTIRPILREVGGMLEGLNAQAGGFGAGIAAGVGNIRAAIQELSGDELIGLLGDGLKFAFLQAMVTVEDGIGAALDLLADGDYWAIFESSLVNIAQHFVDVITDGMLAAIGIVDTNRALQERAKAGDIVSDGKGGLMKLTGSQAAARNSKIDVGALQGFRDRMASRFASRREELAYLREDIDQAMQGIRDRRVSNEADEARKQAELRSGTSRDDELRRLTSTPFHKAMIEASRRAAADRAGIDGAESASLRRFPGLAAGAAYLRSFGSGFGGAFGTPFTGVSGVAGGSDGKGQVSLQQATDYLFDGRLTEAGKQTDLLGRIEGHLAKIESKPIPKPPSVSNVATFGR